MVTGTWVRAAYDEAVLVGRARINNNTISLHLPLAPELAHNRPDARRTSHRPRRG